jgi:Putative adhesin
MSGQQSMFADPEHRPPGQRVRNTDPQEQSWSESEETYPIYAEEASQAQRGGAKIQPGQPKRRNRLLAFVPLIVLAVLLLGSFGLLRAGLTLPARLSQSSQVVYNSQGFYSPEQVIIQDNAGDVSIHGSSQGNVLVTSTNDADKNRVHYRQRGDSVEIFVDDGGSLLSGSTINLDVSLPQGSRVEVASRSGSVDLADINGSVQVDAGSGDIHAQNLNGDVDLHTTSGDIKLDQSSLNSASTISTSSGSITYNGSLAEGGLYRFFSDSGDISLNLPSDTSLRSITRTYSGEIQNDFENSSGAGFSPPHVSVITGSGDIAIKSAS